MVLRQWTKQKRITITCLQTIHTTTTKQVLRVYTTTYYKQISGTILYSNTKIEIKITYASDTTARGRAIPAKI